ncbi:MAG: DUF1080 domain-containing protein [Bacteroidetes bacterium]|jgi:hypothetical protein|uniref:3-keto-disaccharide hydrolase n=1 Tax=Daejeonella sp. TaxID=2805397 RepID=UPI00404A776D|nr:DUF1080 domain-containing protein [Bacteroidota bacterium]
MTKFLILVTLIIISFGVHAAAELNDLQNKPKGIWYSLFDGKSLKGWHLFNTTSEIKTWKIEEGSLVCLGGNGPSGSGDIFTDQTYADFELRWEWKVNKGSNSGIFYHVIEDPKYKRAIETAPEYQIIDDINYPAKLEDSQKSGANYGMHTPAESKQLKPIGEWNTSRLIFKKGRVEHWLNDIRIVNFRAWNKDWTKRKTEGKWKDYPDYGLSKVGRIGLQDHGNKAYFKNIEIREL